MRALVFLAVLSLANGLKFNNYYSDGMMLQRDVKTTLWGYGTLENTEVMATCVLKNGLKTVDVFNAVQITEDVWEAHWESPQTAFTRCDIEMADGELTLKDVLFGDIWICSGQSNMEQNMQSIINSAEEIEEAAAYGDVIRYTMVENQVLDNGDENYDPIMSFNWARADQPDYLMWMSAVGFLWAKSTYDVIEVPIGLVSSDWGGTPVESWSSPTALESCGIETVVNEDTPAWSSSYLWNGMINPLKRNAIKGVLWYQGEANGGYNRDLYNCSFPAMIADWRAEFSKNSPTDFDAPFGFVQLAPWRPDEPWAGFPVIRWHQTADVGYVPNDIMTNVFMSTPIDTFDPDEGYPGNIHPKYKQVAAERLAIAGLNVAYGLTDFPTRGPFLETIAFAQPKEDGEFIEVVFDQDFVYNTEAEISGFYFCPYDTMYCDASDQVDQWMEIPMDAVSQTDVRSLMIKMDGFEYVAVGSIAYLWRESPVKQLLGLPIYAADEFSLPAAPWKAPVVQI